MTTPEEWADKYETLVNKIRETRILFFATTGTMDQMSQRIWGRGELTSGSKLSYKEDYEVYIYKPPFPQAPSGVGKHGAKIKGQWAPSYLAAKATQGRRDTPFELTGDMRIGWLGGPTPTPSEVNPLLVEIRMPRRQYEVSQGLEKTKGPFLNLSSAERSEHVQRLASLYHAILL